MSSEIDDKHLSMIQGVVNRLAGNSFALKGWSVTLVSALLALAAKDADVRLVAIALLPALTFWGLDGYFLAQERLFRKIYQRVIERDSSLPDFSLDPGPCPFGCWLKSVRSPTLLAFHGTVVLLIVLVLAYLLFTAPTVSLPVSP